MRETSVDQYQCSFCVFSAPYAIAHVRSFSGFPARPAPVFPSLLKQTTYCYLTYSLVVYALAWGYLVVSIQPDMVWTSLVMQQSCSDALEDARGSRRGYGADATRASFTAAVEWVFGGNRPSKFQLEHRGGARSRRNTHRGDWIQKGPSLGDLGGE